MTDLQAQYDIIIVTPDNFAIVKKNGSEVWRSRSCRLQVQANRLASEWIDQDSGLQPSSNVITLEVQNAHSDLVHKFHR